ncbi:MAG: CPBP family intramembrane metalloprotease [Promethearchaeota archaeon]|nr:MAG: CPBP family intramembrane metalloprotease [Candidatus Lokiarchaeota archaeon]
MLNENNKNDSPKTPLGWNVCPNCGTKLPKIEDLKFCTSCGIDLEYLKQNKKIPPDFLERVKSYSSQTFFDQYPLRKDITVLSDEEILDTKDKKLWSTLASIGLTILAVFVINFIAVLMVIPFIFFTPSLESFMNSLTSPYFIVITSFAELVLIIVPLIYIKKYLKNPSLKNRLALLGFTTKRMNSLKVVKEILIGLLFSVIGVILVLFVSFFIEAFVELVFGLEIIRDVSASSGDVDSIILSSDYIGLVLLMLTMIFIIGTSEEILFRGFMQKGLVRTLGKRWGMLVTALIFTLIHLIGSFLLYDIFSIAFLVSFILSFFPYLAISYLLGLLFQWRKENLVAVMIMHGFYDALTILLVFIFYSTGF